MLQDTGIHARNISTVSTLDSGECIVLMMIHYNPIYLHYWTLTLIMLYSFVALKNIWMSPEIQYGRTGWKAGKTRKTRRRKLQKRGKKKKKFQLNSRWRKNRSKDTEIRNISKQLKKKQTNTHIMFYDENVMNPTNAMQARRCIGATFKSISYSKNPAFTIQSCDYHAFDNPSPFLPLSCNTSR